MAPLGVFDCTICLQLFKDPVTTACGHTYCKKCIDLCWSTRRGSYSCPQCRQTFRPRPDLRKNTIFAELVEDHERTTGAAAGTDAAPGDVQCDACTGVKRKASMFCSVCLASYCEGHLKPHFEVPPLKKHKLIEASSKVKESICGRHDKLLEIYCRTDQQFICLLCMDEHKGHDIVAVAGGKCGMQRQLEETKTQTADRLLFSENKVTELRQTANFIRDAAWEVCDDFERECEEHIRSYVRAVEMKCSEMRQKVGEAEKAGVDWTDRRLGQMQHQVSELKRREDKLNLLQLTEDPVQFFQGFQALGDLPAVTDSRERLDTLTEFGNAQKEKMTHMCNKEKEELLRHVDGRVLVLGPPRIREDVTSRTYLLTYKYSNMKVDPNTVAASLCLSDGNRVMSWEVNESAHPDHPDRFTRHYQALCKNGLTGNHYWEVEWDGGIVEVAVSYKDIKRKGFGNDCCFGHNDLSWKLVCFPSHCTFWHNNLHKAQIPPARSRKIGVHLHYEAGLLCFYSVCDDSSLTLLHRVKTTFTKPLYPGLCVNLGATIKICNI